MKRQQFALLYYLEHAMRRSAMNMQDVLPNVDLGALIEFLVVKQHKHGILF